jgi:hypothetical protein
LGTTEKLERFGGGIEEVQARRGIRVLGATVTKAHKAGPLHVRNYAIGITGTDVFGRQAAVSMRCIAPPAGAKFAIFACPRSAGGTGDRQYLFCVAFHRTRVPLLARQSCPLLLISLTCRLKMHGRQRPVGKRIYEQRPGQAIHDSRSGYGQSVRCAYGGRHYWRTGLGRLQQHAVDRDVRKRLSL